MTHSWNYKAKQAATHIQNKIIPLGIVPKSFLVLGSGFRDVIATWNILNEAEMSSIPGYPSPKVSGHGAKLILAKDPQNEVVLIATGRVHLYEGYGPFEVSLPIFVAHELGIKNIILTNAAGGVSESAKTGTVVVISDHLNLSGQNISAAETSSNPVQFIDMVNAYDSTWREAVCRDVDIKSGVYAGMFGPTFETPSEARMLKILGADLAGMSTIQEVIAARKNGQKIFACSFVTNQAGQNHVAHNDVLKSVRDHFNIIEKTILSAIKHAPTH